MPPQKRNRRYERHRTYETIRFLRSRGFAVYRQGRFHYVNKKRLSTYEMKWLRACVEAGVRT